MNVLVVVKALIKPVQVRGTDVEIFALSPETAEQVFDKLPPQHPVDFGCLSLYQGDKPTRWFLDCNVQGTRLCFVPDADLEAEEAELVAREFVARIGNVE